MLNDDYAVEIYQSIAEENKDREYKHWHASSISDCPRAHYLKRLGVKPLKQASGAKVIRWGAGHKLEEQLRPHVDKVWDGTTSNVRLTSKKLDTTGEYDNLTKDGSTLIEVKSVSDWAFYRGPLSSKSILKKDSGSKNKWGKPIYEPMYRPYIHHEYQNHVYALLLAEEHIDVKKIDYVYASLSGLLCVYSTEVDPKKLEWVKRRLDRLNKAWKEKRLPPCICKPDSELWGPVYNWCDYRTEDGCCSEDLA